MGESCGGSRGKKTEAEGPAWRLRNRGFLGNGPGSVKWIKRGSVELILAELILKSSLVTEGWGLEVMNYLLPAVSSTQHLGNGLFRRGR